MKKRILFFGKIPPPYIGPAVATEKILNSELKNRYELIHFNISHHHDINDLGKIRLKNIYFPFVLYFRLILMIIREKPDIVYIPSQQTTIGYLRDIPFFIITKFFGVKLVCHLRGGYFLNWYNECNYFMKYIIRKIQKMIDAQIVLGKNLRKLYEPFMDANKIFVVPNGGYYDYSKSPHTEKDQINILFLGNLIRSKGIVDFIKAGLMLPQKFHKLIKMQMAGNWMDCKEEIEQLLKENSKFPLYYLGPTDGQDKNDILVNSDIFIFPTFYRNEGHPWVIVEAMAAGLPIISTDRGAIIESVIDGYNGFIIEPNNPAQISEKLELLIKDKKLRIEMGKNSRNMYEANFTEDNLVNNFSYVFDSISI